MALSPLLEAVHLTKRFPIMRGLLRHVVGHVHAVEDVSIAVYKHEVVALVGESGSGKSTLARLLLQLIEPTSGVVQFEGQNLLELSKREMSALRLKLQVVFQDPYASLNPRYSIGEALSAPLYYHGIVKNRLEAERHVGTALEKVGLNPDIQNRYPHQLSGGQQQRVCIGRAIALNPRLIICDEALSALDVSIQAQILALLMDLKRDLNLSYLFISHDLAAVRYLADRVIVMYLGKVMESGPVEAVFNTPKHPYTKALLDAMPRSHPREDRVRQLLKGEVPSALHPPSGCPFRTRCPYAESRCAVTPPRQVSIDPATSQEHISHCIWEQLP